MNSMVKWAPLGAISLLLVACGGGGGGGVNASAHTNPYADTHTDADPNTDTDARTRYRGPRRKPDLHRPFEPEHRLASDARGDR